MQTRYRRMTDKGGNKDKQVLYKMTNKGETKDAMKTIYKNGS